MVNFNKVKLDKKTLQQEENNLDFLIEPLSKDIKKQYFSYTKKNFKDPDTYAVLAWLGCFGAYHAYLNRFRFFACEFLVYIFTGICFFMGYHHERSSEVMVIMAWIGLGLLSIMAGYHAIFSNAIVRTYNLKKSRAYLIYLTDEKV